MVGLPRFRARAHRVVPRVSNVGVIQSSRALVELPRRPQQGFSDVGRRACALQGDAKAVIPGPRQVSSPVLPSPQSSSEMCTSRVLSINSFASRHVVRQLAPDPQIAYLALLFGCPLEMVREIVPP